MKTLRQLIEGNPLARIYANAQKRRHFVGISAVRSDLSPEENNKRHNELKRKIASQGYGHREVEGHWDGGKEKSIVVHAKAPGSAAGNKLRSDMIAHARHYNQDSILHHNGNTARLVGTNRTGHPGYGKVRKAGAFDDPNPKGKLHYNRPKADFQTSMRKGTQKAQATFTAEAVHEVK